jgi:hypothetical protein
VGGKDHASRPRALCGTDDGSEVVRIGDLIENDQQRLPGGELVRVGVTERLDPGDHALVVAGASELVQRLLRHDLGLAIPAVPRRPLGGEELEHLPATAERLTHRPPAVNELGTHGSGYTTEPPG